MIANQNFSGFDFKFNYSFFDFLQPFFTQKCEENKVQSYSSLRHCPFASLYEIL